MLITHCFFAVKFSDSVFSYGVQTYTNHPYQQKKLCAFLRNGENQGIRKIQQPAGTGLQPAVTTGIFSHIIISSLPLSLFSSSICFLVSLKLFSLRLSVRLMTGPDRLNSPLE